MFLVLILMNSKDLDTHANECLDAILRNDMIIYNRSLGRYDRIFMFV